MRAPAAIYRALQGSWNTRRVFSNNEFFVGKARFKPCKHENNALHYKEKGTYHQMNGQEIVASQQYIYRLSNNQISAYFVDRETGTNVKNTNRLFHILQFEEKQKIEKSSVAKASHLCAADTYKTRYEFISEDEFNIIHIVKGPKKDYNSSTFFRRIKDSAEETKVDLKEAKADVSNPYLKNTINKL